MQRRSIRRCHFSGVLRLLGAAHGKAGAGVSAERTDTRNHQQQSPVSQTRDENLDPAQPAMASCVCFLRALLRP